MLSEVLKQMKRKCWDTGHRTQVAVNFFLCLKDGLETGLWLHTGTHNVGIE